MYKFFFKRFFDFILSISAIILISPLLIPIVVILIFTGEHYIFYYQERIGYKNKKFNLIKFATMLKDSPNIGTGLHTTSNDPRVFPFGSFLRKTKLNEIPQLINIILGSMSVVGPRPLVEKTFDPYSNFVKKNIYSVKPGLSGIGSIIFRDEEKLLSNSKMPMEQLYKKHIAPYKGELELWYLKNISFTTDFLIIFLTLWIIFFKDSKLPYKVFNDLPKRPKFMN